MTIDETTGLPELSKGYFWHIGKDFEGDYVIAIRRGLAIPYLILITSYKEQSDYLSPYNLTKANVRFKAHAIYEKWFSRHEVKMLGKSLTGSYPPKTIKKDTV